MFKNSHCTSEVECTEKCKLKLHGNLITSGITKLNITDYQLACYLSSVCRNFAQVLDDEGKSALHVAASCGRRDLSYWLIKAGKADLNLKDLESGFTPLHRSIFYGHINNAVSFIELGAQTQSMDRDDLQAADHAMKDRVIKDFSHHNPCQVYIWGTNNNYTLGIGNQHSRAQPELLDFFRKNNISISQVAIDKFHSVFLSSGGRVWVCGHGQGGRLGLGSEQTVLSPQPIKTGVEVVVSASIGRNHTILLMESGAVWTCGSNEHHVLGHSPPPNALLTPRPLNPRLFKTTDAPIVGVAAARFHSILWSHSLVLTFGLNGGQLGHQQQAEKTIILPKQVTGLNLGRKAKILDIATSMGAVAVSVTKGDIYLLYNYQIHRIASRILDAVKVTVFGGELNADVDPKLTARGGEEVKVMVLTSTGKLLLWQETFPQMTRCIYPLKRSLTFCGVSMCLTSTLLITKDGEAYIGHVKPKSKKKNIVSVSNRKTENMSFNQFIEKVDCYHMSLSRIPHVHRAVNITSDPKGQNFVVIQENPKVNLTDIPIVEESEFSQHMAALLKEAHEDDPLHDILVKVDNGSVPAHHFVLAQSSEELASLHHRGSVQTLQLPEVHIEVLNQVLTFAYTNDCDILHPGPKNFINFKGDIIKAAIDVAKKLKMSALIRKLQSLRFENGVVSVKESELSVTAMHTLRFERSMFPSHYNVSIASSDGASFKAHKCVLAARLEYFSNMFTGGWIETEATTCISLPVPQTILREVLDFLYKDEAPVLMESQDIDYISSVLEVADQLFIKRLKQICEVALSGNLSLRNAAYLLQFAITYNAEQLKSCSMQFICLNLAAILETRSLEVLDNRTLEELSCYYKNMIPAMCKRVITPFKTQVSEEIMIEVANACPVSWIDSEDLNNKNEFKKLNKSNLAQTTMKKKTVRYRKTSESQRKRVESVSSSSDLDSSMELTITEKIDFDDLVELNDANKPQEWVTIDKTQKSIQNRLKVIMTAPTVQPSPQEFTRLVPIQPLATSPPFKDSKHFPQLSNPASPRVSSSPKSNSIDIKKIAVVKLSQKQRKKLVAEGGMKEDFLKESVSPRPSAWAPVTSVDNNLADIMKTTLTMGSPPSEKAQGLLRFADIVADEIEQRDNLSKMKSKSLHLTQIEDKAMDELLGFYNAANVFDERVTVERVVSANIAKPMWITSRH